MSRSWIGKYPALVDRKGFVRQLGLHFAKRPLIKGFVLQLGLHFARKPYDELPSRCILS